MYLIDSWQVLSCCGCTMMNANKATTGGRAIPDRVILAVVFALVGMTGTVTVTGNRVVVWLYLELLALCACPATGQ